MFTDDITESHPLQLDQPTDACYPGNNRSPSPNSVDMTRPQKQSSVTSHTPATPRGTCLTLNDHDRIRQFLQEFTFRGLLPHVEKNIRQLNDQVGLAGLTSHPCLISKTYAFMCTTPLCCFIYFLFIVFQLVSRKGLSRSLFSATKKLFGGGKVPEKSIADLKNTAGLL